MTDVQKIINPIKPMEITNADTMKYNSNIIPFFVKNELENWFHVCYLKIFKIILIQLQNVCILFVNIVFVIIS